MIGVGNEINGEHVSKVNNAKNLDKPVRLRAIISKQEMIHRMRSAKSKLR
jgi:hypothetical protein